MLNPFDPTPVTTSVTPPVQEQPTDPAPVDAVETTPTAAAPTEAEPAESAEPAAEVDDDEVFEADEVLMAATDQARAALELITPADTIGDYLGYIVEGERVLSLLFDCLMSGYPGWRWTVSLSRVDEDSAPQVLETELMPGDDALLAPEWVPWSDRLADSKAAEELAAAVLGADDDDDDDDDDDESDDDDETDDDDDSDSDDDIGESDDGVDALDGIDFDEALTASELHDGEADEAEPQADGGAPQPPAQARGMQFSAEDYRQNQGD